MSRSDDEERLSPSLRKLSVEKLSELRPRNLPSAGAGLGAEPGSTGGGDTGAIPYDETSQPLQTLSVLAERGDQTDGEKVSSLCPLCSEWSKVILRHHRQPDATSVNWENCSPERWSQDHWELAKAYMPRGLYKVRAFDQCDASALLNLLNFCKWFSAAEPRVVREVIRYRNDLMHSFDMRMDNGWMGRYRRALTHLVLHLSHQWAPLAQAQQQIEASLAGLMSTTQLTLTSLVTCAGERDPAEGEEEKEEKEKGGGDKGEETKAKSLPKDGLVRSPYFAFLAFSSAMNNSFL
ncbi:hypothetical protein CRUP_025927 [Coryphaenoides rupestris]|nr:hypothetical protein CRUP_025927 [Coryphaenoides rupestris]